MKKNLLTLFMLGPAAMVLSPSSAMAQFVLTPPSVVAPSAADDVDDTDEEGEWIAFINEDFSLVEGGSENAPGGIFSMTLPDAWTSLPGWTCGDARPAGQCIFLGSYANVSYPGKGFLAPPKVDASTGGAEIRVSFRARLTEMPEGQDGKTPEADLRNLNILFRGWDCPNQTMPVPLTTEWHNFEFYFVNGGLNTNATFYGHNVLIDDIKFESFIKSLPTPKNVEIASIDENGFSAKWDMATDPDVNAYLVSLYTKEGDERSYIFENKEVNANGIEITDLDMEKVYYINVKSTDGSRSSVESREVQVFAIFKAPVVLEPTDVSAESFTANWEPLNNATDYMVSSYIVHTAPKDEFYPIINDSFDGIGAQFIVAGYLDGLISRAQWYAYELNCADEDCLTLSNAFSFIMPGTLVSPMFDIPADKPQVKVSFRMKGENLGAVQLSLGNGNYLNNTFGLIQSDDCNKLIYPERDWVNYEFTLHGQIGKFSQLVFQAKDGEGTYSIDDLKVEVALEAYQQLMLPKLAVSTTETSAVIDTKDCVYGDLMAYNVFGFAKNQKGEYVTGPASSLMPVVFIYPEPEEEEEETPKDEDGIESIDLSDAAITITGKIINTQGPIWVYNLNGSEVAAGQGTVEIPAPGFYIVRTSAGAAKITVR